MTGVHLHVPADGVARLVAGDKVTAEIDWPRRHRHMRMHTCLHLLSALVPGGDTDDTRGNTGVIVDDVRFDETA